MPDDERMWRKLVESIKRENCILVLGPQVSFDPHHPDQLPLSTLLAHHLADHYGLKKSNDFTNPDDLAYVAQLVRQELRKGRSDLGIFVKDFYDQFQSETTEFHRDLAELPIRLCINTSPDDLFSNALKEAGKNPVTEFYNFKRAGSYRAHNPSVQQPYIYHLYGHRSDWESLVLTEDDLLEFLVNIIKGSPELPPMIRNQVSNNRDKNFLFLGFGFQFWHQRILLQVLKSQNPNDESLAVEASHFFNQPDIQQTVVFYSYVHKIEFKQFSWTDFARKLRDTYEVELKKAEKPKPMLGDYAPKVFLCYASEDQQSVEQLMQQLEENGIQPWQDKSNLRAGDNWDRQLVQVIMKQVDYVIVVQTPAMNERTEGYFYKEIATAKERQSRMSNQSRFILPILLAGGTLLNELEAFHVINLDELIGMNQLVETIQSDWHLRNQAVKTVA